MIATILATMKTGTSEERWGRKISGAGNMDNIGLVGQGGLVTCRDPRPSVPQAPHGQMLICWATQKFREQCERCRTLAHSMPQWYGLARLRPSRRGFERGDPLVADAFPAKFSSPPAITPLTLGARVRP